MKREELLLKDLSARLPYKTLISIDGERYRMEEIRNALIGIDTYKITIDGCDIECTDIKPYLFPLSSMTEEQRIELYKVLGRGYESHYHLSKEWEDFNDSIDNNDLFIPASWVSDINKMYDWCNKNHFDHRGLIPMGLANDATNLNIY